MADPKGFLTTPRRTPARRPVDVRIRDWREVYTDFGTGRLERQAGRCMDCGVPFCHSGCPLGNLIPEWNDLVWRQDWQEAARRLHATNNFPEFTGRLCPAPCETACVLGINSDPVTVYERDDAPGGLLRYGIPEFKLEKRYLDRRLGQLRAEGTRFRCGVNAGLDVAVAELRDGFDALVPGAAGARPPGPSGT